VVINFRILVDPMGLPKYLARVAPFGLSLVRVLDLCLVALSQLSGQPFCFLFLITVQGLELQFSVIELLGFVSFSSLSTVCLES